MTDPETPPSLTAQMRELEAEIREFKGMYTSRAQDRDFSRVADRLAALTVQVERLEQRNRGILQRFYDVTTWLVSEAPYGHVEDGARQEYHDALLALTTLRDELRREGLAQHDEEWWHRSQKLAALRGSDR